MFRLESQIMILLAGITVTLAATMLTAEPVDLGVIDLASSYYR